MASRAPLEQQLDFFDAFAPEYEGWAGGLHGKVADRLAAAAEPSASARVLDVGTGTGLVADRIAAAVSSRGQVIGIDLSEAMLAVARAEAPRRASFVGMAAEALVFRDATFHLVTMGDVLTYLEDPPRALAEAARVLRPRGRLALSVPRRSLATEAQDVFFAVLEDFLRRHPLRLVRRGDERASLGEPEVLADLLADFGFTDVATSMFMTGWRLADGEAWIRHHLGAGPFTHAALTALGPRLRQALAAEVDAALAPLGADAHRVHHAYTVAVARRD